MTWIVPLFIWTAANAAPILDIPQLGPHYRILTLDKSENPQNLLAIYTKLNSNCTLNEDEDRGPALGYYWLMNGRNYKRVHPLILKNIRARFVVEKPSAPNRFAVDFKDLRDLESDLPGDKIAIVSRKTAKGCRVEADLTLGRSNQNAVMRLTGIHSESKKTLWPPFRKLLSVTLRGVDLKTGAEIEKTFAAKR